VTLAWVLLRRFWLPLLIVVALTGSHWSVYRSGAHSVQRQWDAQNQRDQAVAELAARARREQLAQVQLDAEQTQAKLRADAATASTAADRLRKQVARLLAVNPGTAAAGSPAGSDTCGVLAQLLDKSVERARRLATIADTARQRGLSCQSAWAGPRQ
jgi:hypothetical protein